MDDISIRFVFTSNINVPRKSGSWVGDVTSSATLSGSYAMETLFCRRRSQRDEWVLRFGAYRKELPIGFFSAINYD